MINFAKTKINALVPLLSRTNRSLTAEDVAVARSYITNYWPKLTRFHPKDDESLIGLPKPYLVSAFAEGHEFDFNELYYWDSYFAVQGMLDGAHREMVMGILEDLLSLLERFGMIPNASRTYLTSHSQPPLLTSFVWNIYDTYHPGKQWLTRAINLAKQEYQTVWMGTHKPNARQVYEGLSRYYDVNYVHDLAEAESGWDMTPRFNRQAMDYIAVDLNALLYKYEMDFARFYRELDNKREAATWETLARHRQSVVDKLMWDDAKGLYYDYNYLKKRRSGVSSLAAYYPLWVGMASPQQAARLVRSLRRFENKGGLATTDTVPLGQYTGGMTPTQWAYPNGWAPLHFIVVEGLKRYGYQDDARRIAAKWLRTNLEWFNQHGVFLEKYNVVTPTKPPMKGLYPSQTGFGWTNAVFEHFCREFIDRPS